MEFRSTRAQVLSEFRSTAPRRDPRRNPRTEDMGPMVVQLVDQKPMAVRGAKILSEFRSICAQVLSEFRSTARTRLRHVRIQQWK